MDSLRRERRKAREARELKAVEALVVEERVMEQVIAGVDERVMEQAEVRVMERLERENIRLNDYNPEPIEPEGWNGDTRPLLGPH